MMAHDSALTFAQLIKLDGPDFVGACYREILHRDPDEEGQAHHIEALSKGTSKIAMAASIASSEEACLTGSALSPIARRARDALFIEQGLMPAWLRWPAAARVYRRAQEASFRKYAQAIQEAARTGISPIAAVPVEVSRVPPGEWEATAVDDDMKDGSIPQFWFDLTTAFQWTGGVVGIVRAELELACGLKKTHPVVRFSMQVDQGFVEISESEIRWLLDAENVVDAYMKFFGRYAGQQSSARSIHVLAPDREGFFHPYKAGDVILAAGWMDSQKENYFSLLKGQIPDIYLTYLIYDIIMLLEETRHFYPPEGRQRFARYIQWASDHCDHLLYGGQTAKNDTEAYLKERGMRVPPGTPVKFGTDIVKVPAGDRGAELLTNLGVTGKFILTVGSIEPRKNHETLYRAYLLALEQTNDELPQLVIVGKPMWRADDLMNIITRHPRLEGKVLCLRPTDLELAALYENCLFTVLPSLYEGWSLTLPESLGQGRFCLCCDTPPLREIGGTLVDYVEPFDVKGWADKIIQYSSDNKLLARKAQNIAAKWPTTHWAHTAKMAFDAIAVNNLKSKSIVTPRKTASRPDTPAISKNRWSKPTIWIDLTLSYIQWTGGISGIVRAELELARHLKALRPDTRFFAYQTYHDYFFEIDSSYLSWLFETDDLAKAYKSFHDFWAPREQEGSGFRNPFFQAHKPIVGHPAFLPFFPNNTVVFFAGIDSDGTGVLHRSKDVQSLIMSGQSTMTSQLIYDLTPLNQPQFHTDQTRIGFEAFFDQVSNNFDHIVYGGRTAQEDGSAIQEHRRWRSPPSGFIEFGSDINPARSIEKSATPFDDQILSSLGVRSDFAITVGTIEPRKNHEVLYKAYLTLLRRNQLKRPLQLVFVGKPGWNSSDFLATLQDDDRVRGKILVISPTDEQLDVLYRRCLFTMLPSFYEGWSLTLPESLTYGKVCLTSDVRPLREVGKDLVEYIHPLDTYAWADRIAEFANDTRRREESETRIRNNWKQRTWRQSAQMLSDELDRAHQQQFNRFITSVS